MAVLEECKHCGKDIPEPKNSRVTVKKYCSDQCRDEFWNEKRSTGQTYGEFWDQRYGKLGPLDLSEVEKTWLACAIDGEGTIAIWRSKRDANSSGYRFYAAVEVFNTDRRFVEKAADFMDTEIYDNAGNQSKDYHKEVYKASARGRSVERVLREIKDYLVIKEEQARVVLDFIEEVKNAPRRTGPLYDKFEEYWLQMKALNKRGVAG